MTKEPVVKICRHCFACYPERAWRCHGCGEKTPYRLALDRRIQKRENDLSQTTQEI